MSHFHHLRGMERRTAAFVSAPLEARWRREAAGLLRMQCRLLAKVGYLQRAERELYNRAQGVRRRDRRTAIRQIERERQRLGRELHTGVGQMLAAMRLHLEFLYTQLPAPAPPVAQALGRVMTLAQEALQEVRGISKSLHPPEWQRLSLESALQQLWHLSGIAERCEASLRIQPLPQEAAFEVKVLFYRAAQEALSNLMRHARATHVDVSLEQRGEQLVLTIQDDGIGFDVERYLASPAAIGSGIGIRSIRDQAESLGGKLMVKSGALGTKLEVAAPFSANPEGV
jgi:two-component system NarL family sensor kinase